MKTLRGLLAVLLLAVNTLRAQLVADGATNTLNNITNSRPVAIVGTNGSFTLLVLSNNAQISSTYLGVIGRDASAKSNEVRLVSATARWPLVGFGELYVGSNGPASRLTVSGGGFVQHYSGTVGKGVSSSNNIVLITDPGSLWDSSFLNVATEGAFNQITVSNGATLQSGVAFVGGATTASNNLVTVTGTGSLWNQSALFFGVGSTGNRITVSAGGRLSCNNSFVGWISSNNTVLVTDSGSSWTNSGYLNVGDGDRGNQLIASNGASIFVGSDVVVGVVSNATANAATITGAGTQWLVGTNIFVGSNSPLNRLFIGDGAFVTNRVTMIGYAVTSDTNEVLVTGPGTIWGMTSQLEVGFNGSSNRLAISNGAVVSSFVGFVGSSLGGSNNSVFISGPGSAWTNRTGFVLGVNGAFSRLIVTNGGRLHSTNGLVGSANTATNNEAIITGAGSAWNNVREFTVGQLARANRVTISNGGMLTASDTVVGNLISGSNNLAIVSGAGSLLSNLKNVTVGQISSGNQLIVSNGAWVVGSNTFLGFDVASRSNRVTLTDPGSYWTNQNRMRVGESGSGNFLVVSNGAVLGGTDGSLGETAASSNNTVIVTGTNSAWTNFFNFRVGSFGSGNRLVVENGGRIANDAAFVGAFGSRNEARFTGVGTLWNSAAELVIGDQGAANLLVVSNGAVVLATDGTLGTFTSSSNNAAVVTGAGSAWNIADTLYIGRFGPRSQLVVSNAGTVFAGTNLFLSDGISSGSNRIVVTGGTLRTTNASGTASLDIRRGTNVFNAGLMDVDQLRLTNSQGFFEFNGGLLVTRGTTINNGLPFNLGAPGTAPAVWDLRAGSSTVLADYLNVGNNTPFNQLFVTNGATPTNYAMQIGFGASGRSNTVTIAGPGTRWTTTTSLSVGALGSFNSLLISNAASVKSAIIEIGSGIISAAQNQIVVTGNGTLLDQSGDLIVGYVGRSNQVTVSDGAMMRNTSATLGANVTSYNNQALVAGAGSIWSNAGTLFIGYQGAGNQLMVNSGATVSAGDAVYVGFDSTSLTNQVNVSGSALLVTNATATGLLEIRRGTVALNAGLIATDILRMTNGISGKLEINSGTLSIKSSRVSVGNPIIIGNGTSPAALILAGNGTHDMTGTLGLIITNNATLMGNGALLVQLQVRPGATLSPGASIGKISVNTAPFLSGATVMEISKNVTALTNDQFQVTGTLTYGGTLIVSNLGPTALAAGDSFQLFSATTYAGGFTTMTLPLLPSPLVWKNNLLVNGSIEVAAPPALSLSSGSYTQNFDSLSLSGGANLWRDNVTLLGWYAAKSNAPSNITSYVAADGSDNAGALYSFGSTGSPERALGDIPSNSTGDIAYGLGFTNDTGSSISNFTITFTGEQWRNGSGVTNTLTFWYRVIPTALTNPEPGIVANWIQVTNLNFISPQTSVSATALDGNQATNRQTFSAALVSGLVVPSGQNVFFRWHDPNDVGADQGLAVDDLTVSFSAVISTRAFGVDVSHFQNESGIPQASWDQMFAEGKRFVFVKATEGLTGPHDPTMSNNVARASAAGLLAGVYHFAHPENRPTTNGAILEASNLVVYAGSAIGPGRLRPVLDLEGSAANLSTTALTDWVIAFSDEIIARRGPGAAPIIYCSQTFANNELDSRLADYDLWLRTVGSGADVAFDDPPGQGFADATGVFNNWSFWQYSATGSSGGISPLDLDVCHNEYKPLSSYLIPGQPPTPINLTGITVTGGNVFQFGFTNTPGASFTVLASTNASLPMSNWTVLGPITETSPGQFQFGDSQATNHPQRYYRVQSP